MKNKNNLLFLGLTVLCGGIAAVLRMLMLTAGVDEKGLLVAAQPCNTALWVLSVGYLGVLLVLLRRLGGNGSFENNFPACKIRGGLSVVGGVVLLVESGLQLMAAQWLMGVVGLLAGLAMIGAGASRFGGKRPNPLMHTLVCVFFILRLIGSFRSWSSDPQLQDYALQMMACVCLMLFSFHRASCDADLINRRRTVFFGLAAAYFCLASLSDKTMPLLFLGAGVWTVGAGCNLQELPREEKTV